MSQPPKIGDARLAERVIGEYADGVEGLTQEECEALGIDNQRYVTLKGVLQNGRFGEVTKDERARLEKYGFTKEFSDALAGADGKRALRERVKWLGDHCHKKLLRRDADYWAREKMIDELADMGRDAAGHLIRLPMLLQKMTVIQEI